MIVSLTLAACGGGGGGGGNNGGGGGGRGGGGITNKPPTVTTTTFTVNQDTDLAGKIAATDPENDTLTLAKTGDPSNGGTIVSFGADGSFVYRPKAGYRGTDTFTISVKDPTHTITATITITVAAVNHTPVIRNDIVTIHAADPTIA